MNVLRRNTLGAARPIGRFLGAGDAIVLLGLIVLIYAAIRLASPTPVIGPEIDLSVSSLPWYALLSFLRLLASYILSLAFCLVYGYTAARSRKAERLMLPVLDVLQSVPLLSFLPVIMVVLTTILPQRVGVEIAAIILIFTCQAWNIAYSLYQSLRTTPVDLDEASSIFRLNWWYRLRHLELPFSVNGLLWNSMISWANGWFFLMAAETFRVGDRDFRLLGLGSYLQAAADAGEATPMIIGFAVLVLLIVLMDQLIWRPLLAWADKFRADLTESENAPRSWFYDLTRRSALATGITSFVVTNAVRFLDRRLGAPIRRKSATRKDGALALLRRGLGLVLALAGAGTLAYGAVQAIQSLVALPLETWGQIGSATLASGARVFASALIGLLWTLPVGVAIGTNPNLSAVLQPVVQIVASIPATALFPILVLFMVRLPFGLDGAAILLMLLGAQWYILFNIIAGASALPQELKDVTRLFKLSGWVRWRTLLLPALFPYIVTGLNIATGAAWNASIVAEYTQYDNQTYSVPGLGATISNATATGNYTLLLAATLTMIVVVIGVNRFVWHPLHLIAEEKYRLDI